MPCTVGGCCNTDTKSIFKSFGYDVCPKVAPPCGGDSSASCAGAIIQGVVESKEFLKSCFTDYTPKVYYSFGADNFGYIQGQGSPIFCPNYGSDACTTCYIQGILTPEIIPGKNAGYKKMKVSYLAQNAPHGGPYSVSLSLEFYFEDEEVG
jgi:hypothetical protein